MGGLKNNESLLSMEGLYRVATQVCLQWQVYPAQDFIMIIRVFVQTFKIL